MFSLKVINLHHINAFEWIKAILAKIDLEFSVSNEIRSSRISLRRFSTTMPPTNLWNATFRTNKNKKLITPQGDSWQRRLQERFPVIFVLFSWKQKILQWERRGLSWNIQQLVKPPTQQLVKKENGKRETTNQADFGYLTRTRTLKINDWFIGLSLH